MDRMSRGAWLCCVAALATAGCDTNVNDGSVPFAVTDRVSLTASGGDADAACQFASMSADGNRIAFQSAASNLVPGDNGLFLDVFVRDLVAGTTIRISRSSAGSDPNGTCQSPVISADGQYVAFHSAASNLVPGDVNALGAIYRTHVDTGTTARVSVAAGGGDTDGAPAFGGGSLGISQDGRFVTFACNGTNLEGGPAAPLVHIYRRDMNIPGASAGDTVRISRDDLGGEPDGPASGVLFGSPSISGDGRFVSFTSNAQDLLSTATPELGLTQDIYLWDASTGDIVRVSNALLGGEPTGDSTFSRVSADGNFVCFQSTANDLVANDTSGVSDVFRWTRASGAIVRCSVTSSGGQQSLGSVGAVFAGISGDGSLVSFQTDSTNLFLGDFNGQNDVVIRDVANGVTFVASVATFGTHLEPGAQAGVPCLSADGRFVAFQSISSTLVGDDLNSVNDIFRRGPLR